MRNLWCDEAHTHRPRKTSTDTGISCYRRRFARGDPGVGLGHGHGARIAPLGLAPTADRALSRLTDTRHLLVGGGIVPMEQRVAVRALVLVLAVPGEAPSIQLAGEAGELGLLPKVGRHHFGDKLILGVDHEGVAAGHPRHDFRVGWVIQHLHELLGEGFAASAAALVAPRRCDGRSPLLNSGMQFVIILIELGPLGTGGAVGAHSIDKS